MPEHTVEAVWVDEHVCLAHYLCVSEAPLIFEENEKVWTVQVREGVSSYVFRENSDDLLWAAAVCPVSAIKLRLDTGEVVDGDSEVIRAFLASARKR